MCSNAALDTMLLTGILRRYLNSGCRSASVFCWSPPSSRSTRLVLTQQGPSTDLSHAAEAVLYVCESGVGSIEQDGPAQIAFLDSLTSVEPPALKRRRIRNQHFWRDSDKLALDERVYVRSADVQLAMEAGVPVMPVSQLSQSEHTSTWTVCLTALGAKELLNRKISPLGVRLFRAMQSQLELQQQDMQLQLAERGLSAST